MHGWRKKDIVSAQRQVEGYRKVPRGVGAHYISRTGRKRRNAVKGGEMVSEQEEGRKNVGKGRVM